MTSRPHELAKRAGMGLLAGLLGGLLLGVGGRLVMTAIALAAGLEVRFSPVGSLEVLATGLLIGTPAGLVYVVLRNYLPLPGVWKGAAFGALLFLGLVLLPPPAARSAVTGVGQLPVTLALFGVLFVLYGVMVEILLRRPARKEEKQ